MSDKDEEIILLEDIVEVPSQSVESLQEQEAQHQDLDSIELSESPEEKAPLNETDDETIEWALEEETDTTPDFSADEVSADESLQDEMPSSTKQEAPIQDQEIKAKKESNDETIEEIIREVSQNVLESIIEKVLPDIKNAVVNAMEQKTEKIVQKLFPPIAEKILKEEIQKLKEEEDE